MIQEEVIERVDSLEFVLGQFIVQTNKALQKLTKGLDEFKNEMKEFKNEMKEFKNEMKEFKSEMKDFKNEMLDFKTNLEVDRRQEAKDRMQETRNWNKKWGELSNKMGSIVEDIISPAVRPVVENYFKCNIIDFSIHRRKNLGEIYGEFDVVAVSEKNVFLVEVKTSPNKNYIKELMENIDKFKFLFPEHKHQTIIPIIASLRFDNHVIQFCTENNILAMAYREWEYMDLLNFNEVKF
jgi:uncharacterized protein YhaN